LGYFLARSIDPHDKNRKITAFTRIILVNCFIFSSIPKKGMVDNLLYMG